MSPSSKNAKNIKIQDRIRLKIIKWNICIMRFQITDKQVVICPQEEEKKKKKSFLDLFLFKGPFLLVLLDPNVLGFSEKSGR